MGTSGSSDAGGIAVPAVSPACPLALVGARLLSTDSRDAHCDSTVRRVAVVRGSASSRVARTITRHRRSARRTTVET